MKIGCVNPYMPKPSLKAPTKIKIGPLDFDIRWYDRTEEDREARYGYSDANELIIGISERLAPAKKADTFMHEAIHALWYVFGMAEKEYEENAASRLGIGIAMIARDNPELFRWWLSLLE